MSPALPDPKGCDMLKFYYHPTPNPMKIALYLAETGLPYELVPVDTAEGKQHSPEFRAINPNGKVPAIDVIPSLARKTLVDRRHLLHDPRRLDCGVFPPLCRLEGDKVSPL